MRPDSKSTQAQQLAPQANFSLLQQLRPLNSGPSRASPAISTAHAQDPETTTPPPAAQRQDQPVVALPTESKDVVLPTGKPSSSSMTSAGSAIVSNQPSVGHEEGEVQDLAGKALLRWKALCKDFSTFQAMNPSGSRFGSIESFSLDESQDDETDDERIAAFDHMESIISILFRTADLTYIKDATVPDPLMPKSRLFRNVSRLVERCGKHAEREARSALERRAAVLLRTAKSTRMAADHVVRSRSDEFLRRASAESHDTRPGTMRQPLTPSYVLESASAMRDGPNAGSNDGTKVPQQYMGSELTDFEALVSFFTHSRACEIFRTDLLDFLHRPYEYRLSLALRCIDEKTETDQTVTYTSTAELSWVPPQLSSIQEVVHLSTSDRAKSWVEDALRQKVNWWPLQQKVHELDRNHSRLHWLTVSLP